MRTTRKTIEQLVIEESDFKELNLKFGQPLGQFTVIEMKDTLIRYVCQPIQNNMSKREYQVLFSYNLNYAEIDKLRNGGCL